MAGRDPVSQAQPVEGAVPEQRRYVVTISPVESHTYHFHLVDAVGLENSQPVRLSLQVIDDEAPRARLKVPGVGYMITPEAVLPIELEFTDTYGLATAEWVYRIRREEIEEQPHIAPSFEPYMTTLSTSLLWPVSSEGVVPGERLTLFSRATDYNTVTGPNVGQSHEVTMQVVTQDELLAELARREQELRMDFERLIDAQERLRGRLLTVLGRFPDPGPLATLAEAAAPLERSQRNIAGSINVIRQQFERILAELGVNQLDTDIVHRRLGEGIIDPLTRLAKRDLISAADTIRGWSTDGSPDAASRIDSQQIALLSQLRAILANMLQWEGYQEVVNMLRDIVRLQGELNAESRRTVEEHASEIFDD